MVTAVALVLTGCSSHARVWVVPAEGRKISPRRPLVARYDLPEAYFWINRSKELCVVLSRGPASGPGAFDLSLVLEGVPAGQGRHYRIDRRTTRALFRRDGPWNRAASYRGIVRVWFDKDDPNRLHGRFRIWANVQEYKFWMDFWTNDSETMFVGEFEADRNRAKGEKLLQRTEVQELKRGPPLVRPRPITGPPLQPDRDQQ